MQESKLLFHELPPFFENDSETLILGSFPSPKSRECGFYYGHPQNRFWKTLAAVFKEEIPVNIEEKKEFLRRQKIALWDVIASCEIKGAEDGSIRRAKANDLSVILNAAAIRKILTTGKTAFSFYRRDTGESIRLVLTGSIPDFEGMDMNEYCRINDPASLFTAKATVIPLPERARIFDSYICESCGEKTGAAWIHIQDGRRLCPDCAVKYDRFRV